LRPTRLPIPPSGQSWQIYTLFLNFKQLQDARCRMQDARYKMQDARCKMQDMQDDFKKILLGKYITFLKKAD
jgi:hypothetical protein